MRNEIFAHNPYNIQASINLISVYNTKAYPPFISQFPENRGRLGMNCAIFTLDGEGQALDRQQNTYNLTKGTVFFGEYRQLHSLFFNQGFWKFTCYWFSATNIEIPLMKIFTISDFDSDRETKDVNKIIKMMQEHTEKKIVQANAFFTYKILTLLDNLPDYAPNSNQLFNKIIFYVNSHLKEKISVKDIAKEFGYCEKHIRTLFHNSVNMSPQKYIMKVKLEQICNFLLMSSLTLQEIAETFNFYSSSHLVSCFKKEYGYTPKQFKTRNSTIHYKQPHDSTQSSD